MRQVWTKYVLEVIKQHLLAKDTFTSWMSEFVCEFIKDDTNNAVSSLILDISLNKLVSCDSKQLAANINMIIKQIIEKVNQENDYQQRK